MDSENKYYPYFDYLRGFAALGVYLSHNDSAHFFPDQLGNACVQLFFALSGFLIGGILFRSHPKELPRFYFNRATRIWIPYAIAVGLLFVVTATKQGLSDPKLRECFFYMATFVYNWFGTSQLAEFHNRMPLNGTGNHFWSICVEEQFYLVAPFIIIFASRSILFLTLAAATWISPNYFASISLGVILALAGPRLWLVIGSALLGLSAAFFLKSYVIAAPLISMAVIGSLSIAGKPTRIGKTIGGISYPFYLNHWIGLFVQNFLVKHGVSILLAMPFGFTIIAGGCAAHYFAIDKAIAARRNAWFTVRFGKVFCIIGITLALGGFGGAWRWGWPL